jgi:geranylgeranyl diphosphate synthase, type I
MDGTARDEVKTEAWPGLDALIQRVLEDELGRAYGKHLLDTAASWLRPNLGPVSISTLPVLTCQACGGTREQAEPVGEAWQAVRLAVKLFDDVEDGDADDPALATNAAISLLVAAQLLLAELPERGLPPESASYLERSLKAALLAAAAGQHRDLLAARSRAGEMTPDVWLQVAAAKSGQPLSWAAAAGAVVAGASSAAQRSWSAYGQHLGVLLQIADDFGGVWGSTRQSDLARGMPGLPICYARFVMDGSQQTQLDRLLARAATGDRAAEAEAGNLITAAGAQSYTLVAADVQYQAAKGALRQAGAEATVAGQALVALLDSVFPALGYVRGQG